MHHNLAPSHGRWCHGRLIAVIGLGIYDPSTVRASDAARMINLRCGNAQETMSFGHSKFVDMDCQPPLLWFGQGICDLPTDQAAILPRNQHDDTTRPRGSAR